MKKLLFLSLFVLLFAISSVSCSNGIIESNATDEEESTISVKFTIEKNEDSNNTENYPTNDDIKKYNEILKVLNSDYSKSEDELLKQFESSMNMEVQEIKDYLNWVMPYAVGLREIPANINSEPSFAELALYAKNSLESITDSIIKISDAEDDWEITKTNLRYVMTSKIEYDGVKKETIIKIEFDDYEYLSYSVFQLKIDGINISVE